MRRTGRCSRRGCSSRCPDRPNSRQRWSHRRGLPPRRGRPAQAGLRGATPRHVEQRNSAMGSRALHGGVPPSVGSSGSKTELRRGKINLQTQMVSGPPQGSCQTRAVPGTPGPKLVCRSERPGGGAATPAGSYRRPPAGPSRRGSTPRRTYGSSPPTGGSGRSAVGAHSQACFSPHPMPAGNAVRGSAAHRSSAGSPSR